MEMGQALPRMTHWLFLCLMRSLFPVNPPQVATWLQGAREIGSS